MIGKNCVINPATNRAVKASGKIGQRILAGMKKTPAAPPAPKPVQPPAPKPVQPPAPAPTSDIKIKDEEFEVKYNLAAFKKLRQPFNLSSEDGKTAYKIKAYIFRNNAETFANKIKKLYSKLTDAEKTSVNTELLRSIVNDDYFKEIEKYYNTTVNGKTKQQKIERGKQLLTQYQSKKKPSIDNN
jgi:hypothetical protein